MENELSTSIIKYNPLKNTDKDYEYIPAFLVINKKIYQVENWREAFQLLMFSYITKPGRNSLYYDEVNITDPKFKTILINDTVEESAHYVKFSPEDYIFLFTNTRNNYRLLSKIRSWTGDFELYILKYPVGKKPDDCNELIKKKIKELIRKRKLKNGSTRHLLAHVNGKVLSPQEKFYRHIETEFDEKSLIGDIEMPPESEPILKRYMKSALNCIVDGEETVSHPKVFSYGMVKLALDYYSNKTLWPHVEKVYGIHLRQSHQSVVNNIFAKTLRKYGKLYDENTNLVVQNMCMHAFICSKCADQLFDYIFDFWRIDLCGSIENIIEDDGNDLFNVLIEEISQNDEYNVQDIMMHTTMALKLNTAGCKNRLRRILKMVDNSYFNDTDYSKSKNRINQLFEQWKRKESSSYMKELHRDSLGRKGTRGEKLLSRPTLLYKPKTASFVLYLPKQRLRNCTEEEHPIWTVTTGSSTLSVEPKLLRGKLLYTEETELSINTTDLFEEFDLVLHSENGVYYQKKIKADNYRFFTNKDRNIEYDTILSKDIRYLFTKKGFQPKFLNGSFTGEETWADEYDRYTIDPREGDILLLSDQAVSVGIPLREGIIGKNRVAGVKAIYQDEPIEIVSDREQIFFKTTNKQFKGTALRVFYFDKCIFSGRLCENEFREFKVDESLKDIYGYIIDLHDYIKNNGIYRIELDIPRLARRNYRMCYIKKFKYRFLEAPYLFADHGTLSFPSYLDVITDSDWENTGSEKRLTFKITSHEQNENTYTITDQQLLLKYKFKQEEITMIFDLPVLYWKMAKQDEWSTQRPEDISIRNLPNNIYISGGLNVSTASLAITNGGDLDENTAAIQHDVKNDLYYFRMADLATFLNRDETIRNVHIIIDNKDSKFFGIVCKSRAVFKGLTGDFDRDRIIGYFDIFGSNDYMVTLKYNNELIEEDIPVINGRFETESPVREGIYKIILYELEDDDSGFDSISYELGSYKFNLIDVRNFSGKKAEITYIRDRQLKYAALSLKSDYEVRDLEKLDYKNDIDEVLDPYIWDYEVDKYSSFTYYRGNFGCLRRDGTFKWMSKVLLIFDNPENTSEAILNLIQDGECSSVMYHPDEHMLIENDSRYHRVTKRIFISIDNDTYKIGIEVK